MESKGDFSFEVVKDYGEIGDTGGKWQLHLALVSFNGNEPKYDIRQWNEDMTKMGKGVRLDDGQLYDLMCMIEDAMDSK